MVDDWKMHDIYKRSDGTYVITRNGLPYHVSNDEIHRELLQEVDAYANDHPDVIKEEQTAAYAPSLEDAKKSKLREFKQAMSNIDIALVRPMSQLLLGTNSVATLVEDDAEPTVKDDAAPDMTIFTALREAQERNRSLRKQVIAAQSIEEVQAVEPVTVDRAALTGA